MFVSARSWSDSLYVLCICFWSSHRLNKTGSIASTTPDGAAHKMIDLIMWVLWFMFGGYCVWFLIRARKSEPLTLDDLVVLWKIHRQQSGCNAPLSKVEPIVNPRSNEFSGFKCKCGYQYQSQRLIIQRHALERSMFMPMSANNTERSQFIKT